MVPTAGEADEHVGLLADVVQRHRRPDHLGGAETVEALRQLGEVGGDSASDAVGGGSLCRSVEHGGRTVDGDHAGHGEQPRQLARAHAGPATDVEDAPDRRGVGTAELGDPAGAVGDEPEQQLALELGVGGKLRPVGLVEVGVPVVRTVPVGGHGEDGRAVSVGGCSTAPVRPRTSVNPGEGRGTGSWARVLPFGRGPQRGQGVLHAPEQVGRRRRRRAPGRPRSRPRECSMGLCGDCAL